MSAACAVKSPGGKSLVRRSLAEGLGLPADPSVFVVFREHMSGLEFIRSAAEIAEAGLAVALGAFQYQVFLDFRQVRDETGTWARLCAELAGRGVPRMDDARLEMELRPLHEPLRELTSPDTWGRFLRAARPQCLADDEKSFIARAGEMYRAFLDAAGTIGGAVARPGEQPLIAPCLSLIRAIGPGSTRPPWLDKRGASSLDRDLADQPAALPCLWMWALLAPVGDRIEEWRLDPLIREFVGRAGATGAGPGATSTEGAEGAARDTAHPEARSVAHPAVVEGIPGYRLLHSQAGWMGLGERHGGACRSRPRVPDGGAPARVRGCALVPKGALRGASARAVRVRPGQDGG